MAFTIMPKDGEAIATLTHEVTDCYIYQNWGTSQPAIPGPTSSDSIGINQ
ncbi:MAG: hypothetical protein AB4042_18940 [Leptolyngbyaceae cyanobacterium]